MQQGRLAIGVPKPNRPFFATLSLSETIPHPTEQIQPSLDTILVSSSARSVRGKWALDETMRPRQLSPNIPITMRRICSRELSIRDRLVVLRARKLCTVLRLLTEAQSKESHYHYSLFLECRCVRCDICSKEYLTFTFGCVSKDPFCEDRWQSDGSALFGWPH